MGAYPQTQRMFFSPLEGKAVFLKKFEFEAFGTSNLFLLRSLSESNSLISPDEINSKECAIFTN